MLTAAETRRSEAEGELVLAQQVRSPCLCVHVCLCVSWGSVAVSLSASLSRPRMYGWQALRSAFEEEAAALQSALQSAEGALSRAEAWAQTGGTEDEERSREEAKQRYVGDVHYKGQSVRLSVCRMSVPVSVSQTVLITTQRRHRRRVSWRGSPRRICWHWLGSPVKRSDSSSSSCALLTLRRGRTAPRCALAFPPIHFAILI